MLIERRHTARLMVSAVLLALGASGCANAVRLHDESKAKLATGIKDKYTQANVLGVVEVEKKNLDNLLAEELKVVRDNQRLRVDYALLSMADGGEPMAATWASGLKRLTELGYASFAAARAAELGQIRLGAPDRKLQRDAGLIKAIVGSDPPQCGPQGLPAVLSLPATLNDTDRGRATALYQRYREDCEDFNKKAFQASGVTAGALKDAEDEWKAARDEAGRLGQSVKDGQAAVKDKTAAHEQAVQAVAAAEKAGPDAKSKAEATAKSALEALQQAEGLLRLVQTRDDASQHIDALVVLLTAAAEGKIESADPKLTAAATVAKAIPSLEGDMVALLARKGAPSVSNLLIEMRHQVLLLEYVKQLQGFAQQRADILKARYDALREEARLWRSFHDAMCSYAERSADRPHPGAACDRFMVSDDLVTCGIKPAGENAPPLPAGQCGLAKPWNESLRARPSKKHEEDAMRELYKAVAAYLRALAVQGTQHEQTFRVIDVHHREALAGREAALRGWDNLVTAPVGQLDAYYQAGLKPAEIADLLIKALGFTAVAGGVAARWAGGLALVLATGCATPSAPQLLADRTAANAGVISAHLRTLARDSADLADLRAANIARLHAANAQSRASYNYDFALTKKSGGADNLDLMDQLDAWGKEVDGIFQAAANAERERKTAVLATQTALDTKSDALAQIAEALAALARDDSPAERAKFLAGYAREVGKDLDKQLAESNKSATEAKGLLSGVQDKVNTVTKQP
jgi:hypothetical protein